MQYPSETQNMRFLRTHSIPAVAVQLVALLAISVSVGGCGRGKKSVPGLSAFQVGVLQGNLYASFTAASLSWDAGLTVPIPGLNGASASISPDLNSPGTVFQFSIPVAALINGGKPLPALGLPDGRPLPDVRGGALPRWDTPLGKLSLSLYLSNDAFGLFVPIEFIGPGGITLPKQISITITDERGNVLGRAYAIPSSSASTGNVSGTPDADGGSHLHVNSSGSGLFILLPYLGGSS